MSGLVYFRGGALTFISAGHSLIRYVLEAHTVTGWKRLEMDEFMDGKAVRVETLSRFCSFFGVSDKFLRGPPTVKLALPRPADDDVASLLRRTRYAGMSN